ncbi:oxidoreductase [Polychaeton citri CBS 116435]|uniref:Oxidoreductase n=1 Tax=Polychaeton citri CBS 116435 TaxID=1314669 RepID=A0A9P4UU31_9PEZI|nr:oxidoreductase [Polychaeton citri CBS 116435]
MSKFNFDPEKDIPSLTGKVILVTGGTAGLGKETVISLASHSPAHIYFSGRSQKSADSILTELKSLFPQVPVSFLRCDLASLASVQQAAKEFVSKSSRLDILIANAGIMALPHGLTKDGYELQFGTNHMGHALLAKLLAPTLEATAEQMGEARIVWLTSEGYMFHNKGGIPFELQKTPKGTTMPVMGRWYRYGQSKLANLLYARAFAKYHPTITSVSVHPGVSATGLVDGLGFFDRYFIRLTTIGKMIGAKECAFNSQWAATAPVGEGEGKVESGKFYMPVGEKKAPECEGGNDELMERLWHYTHDELNAYDL